MEFDKLQLRRDTEANWQSKKPTLLQGEIGYVIDSSGNVVGKKVGNGKDAWGSLPLYPLGGIDSAEVTVTNTTGTPSATAEVVDGKLKLTFTNIKGEKGADGKDGATGATGATGPKGEQGEATRVRMNSDKEFEVSYDGGASWEVTSEPFQDNIHIEAYVDSVDQLHTGVAIGTVYSVKDSTYTAENPRYRVYVYTSNGWVDNGLFGGIAAGVSQTAGNKTDVVMSQKAVTDMLGILPLSYSFAASSSAQYCEKINVDVFGRFFFRAIEVVGTWRFIITYADGTTSYNNPANYINGANKAAFDPNGKGISTIQFYMQPSDTEGSLKVEFIFSEALIRKEQGEAITTLQQSKLDNLLLDKSVGDMIGIGLDYNTTRLTNNLESVDISKSVNLFNKDAHHYIIEGINYSQTNNALIDSAKKGFLLILGKPINGKMNRVQIHGIDTSVIEQAILLTFADYNSLLSRTVNSAGFIGTKGENRVDCYITPSEDEKYLGLIITFNSITSYDISIVENITFTIGGSWEENFIPYDESKITYVNSLGGIAEAIEAKLDKNFGGQNKGKALIVGTDGNVTPMVDLFTEVKSESDNPFVVSDAKIFDALQFRDTGKVIATADNNYALVNLGVITTAQESYYIRSFIDGSNDIDALPTLLSSLGVTAITPIEIATEEVSVGSTFLSRGYDVVATRGGGYITGCAGGNYLYIQIQFNTSQNKSNNLQKILDWLVVNPSGKTGKNWPTEYIAGPTISIIPAFPTKEEVATKLDKNFGTNNANKQLVVGEDGNVTLKDALESDADVTACVRAKNATTLNLGDNLISDIVGTGTNWTHADGKYTHTTGSAVPLTFNYDTVAGKAYVAILYTGTSDFYENYINVSIGDGELCDIYKGITGPYYIGIISTGGKLKITPDPNFNSYVHSVELREVVAVDDAVMTYDYPNLNVNINSGDDITGFWNIAVGAANVMQKLQNGSRNIAIGNNSLSEMTSGERNIAIGTFALNQLKRGTRNIAIGADALYRAKYADKNVAIGKAAAGFTHADPSAHRYEGNTAVGYNALGSKAGDYNNNTALGANAMGGNVADSTDRDGNVAVGYEAGYYAGNNNVSIGKSSNRYTTGDNNVSVGADTGDITETGSNNILIGKGAKVYSGEGTWQNKVEHNNSIVIGTDAVATKSNQVVIGNAQQTEVILLGNKKIRFNTDGTVTWESV